jgi:hypothetical protein
LDISEPIDSNPKYNLNKIYFSQKGNAIVNCEKIESLINYCFNRSTNFISAENKTLIYNYLEYIKINDGNLMTYKTMDSILNEDDDISILQNLLEDFSSIECSIENLKDIKIIQYLQYLFIWFIDLIILKDILPRTCNLILKNDKCIIEEVVNNENENIHPDVKLIMKVNLLPNIYERYIGTSHLCCFNCSIIIDSYGFHFRGINKKFEIKWTIPSEIDFNHEKKNKILLKIEELAKKLKKENKFTNFEISFNSPRITDTCQHASNLIAADICYLLKYYERSYENYNFILQDFNKNPLENIRNLKIKIFKNQCLICNDNLF